MSTTHQTEVAAADRELQTLYAIWQDVRKKVESRSLVAIARTILDKHPTAAWLVVDSSDQGDHMTSESAYDGRGDELDIEGLHNDLWTYASNLDDSDGAWWRFFAEAVPDDPYRRRRLDLHKIIRLDGQFDRALLEKQARS